jgi:flagellar basal-body rod protein FlgF
MVVRRNLALHFINIVFIFCWFKEVKANNSVYINLSNYIAKSVELETISNNVANQNTVGYEEDNTLSSTYIKKTGKASRNLFVAPKSNFLSKEPGAVLITNRDLDLAISGDGYFKVLTPRGFRYTLDGNIQVNSENVLVTKDGYPYLDNNNQEIIIPIGAKIYVNEEGTIFADQDEVAQIGVFIIDRDFLIKEGSNLYLSKINDMIAEEKKIISGVLRKSNVNSYKNMANVMELDSSIKTTNGLMNDVLNLEKKAIESITK